MFYENKYLCRDGDKQKLENKLKGEITGKCLIWALDQINVPKLLLIILRENV